MNRTRTLESGIAILPLIVTLLLGSVTPAFADAPYQRRDAVVFMDDADKFVRSHVLLTTLLNHFYDLRVISIRGLPMDRVRTPEPFAGLTAAMLEEVDVLVLPSFHGRTTVGTPDGTRTVDNNLTTDEAALLEDWIRAGGSLLVVAYATGENNLPGLLARFGLTYRPDTRTMSDETLTAHGSLQGRGYALSLPGLTWSITGGDPIVTMGDRVVGAMASLGYGQVAFLGNSQFFDFEPMVADGTPARPPVQGAIDRADNMAFLVDLLASLSGQPLLSLSEREHMSWDVKLMALSAALAPTDILNYQPRSSEGSDFANARGLLRAADEGRRCDMGPGCVAFTIDEAARLDLEQAAVITDRALASLAQAETALSQQDYAQVPPAYETAIENVEDALATVRRVRERYDPVARASYRQPAEAVMLQVLAAASAVIGLLVVGGLLLASRKSADRR